MQVNSIFHFPLFSYFFLPRCKFGVCGMYCSKEKKKEVEKQDTKSKLMRGLKRATKFGGSEFDSKSCFIVGKS